MRTISKGSISERSRPARERYVRVNLTEVAEGRRSFAHVVALHSEGSACVIGTASVADLVLPRCDYIDLARQQCTITFMPAGNFIQNTSRATRCVLDGLEFGEERVELGEHDLVLGEHSFRLLLLPTDAPPSAP